jgi:hypothetical protein
VQAVIATVSMRESFRFIAVVSGGASGSGRITEQTALAIE